MMQWGTRGEELESGTVREGEYVCMGLRGEEFNPLKGVASGGRVQVAWLMRQDLRGMGHPELADKVDRCRRVGMLANGSIDAPSWYGCGECLRSSFCTGRSMDDAPCHACDELAYDPSLRKRLSRKRKRTADGQPHKKTRNDYLSNEEARKKLDHVQVMARGKRVHDLEKVKTIEALRKSVSRLKARVLHLEESGTRELKQFCKDLTAAEVDGALDDKVVLRDLLEGVASALKKGTRQGTKITMNEYAFYSTLLSTGGAWVCEFVSKHLAGPHVDTIRKMRNARVMAYGYGDEEELVQRQVNQVAETVISQWGQYVDGVISEDGSAMLDYLEAHPNKAGEIEVWGLSGGPLKVSTIGELEDALRDKNSATTFYPYLWVPLAPGAKALPLMILCHDNTKKDMSACTMVRRWKLLWKCLCKAKLNPIAHYGDGDKRFRAACVWLGSKGTKKITIDHPLINLHVRAVTYKLDDGSTREIAVMGGIDPLHINWRMLRQYLDANRALTPGGLLAVPTTLERFQRENKAWHLGINHSHLNFNNKTNFGGVLKLSDHKLDKYGGVIPANHLRRTLRERAQPRVADGELVYIEFMNRMVGVTWVKCRRPLELVHDLVWVMIFCLLWEEGVETKKPDKAGKTPCMKKHCLTRETLDDIQIYCQEMLLGMKRHQLESPNTTFLPDRRSSRFSEYFFGDMRMAIRGQMKFSSKSALRLTQIALTKYSAEQMSDVVTMGLRRYKHNDAEEKMYRDLPEGYWDFDIEDEIKVGVEKCLQELRKMHFDTVGCTPGNLKNLGSLKNRDTRFETWATRLEKDIRAEESPSGPGEEENEEDEEDEGEDISPDEQLGFPTRGSVTADGNASRAVMEEWQDLDTEEGSNEWMTPEALDSEVRRDFAGPTQNPLNLIF